MTEGSPITDVTTIDISKPEVIKNVSSEIDLSKALVLDSHLIKTHRACEMKYFWFEECHLVGRGKAAAPGFGITMHEGIEWFRRSKIAGKGFSDCLNIGAGHLIDSYRRNMPVEMQQEVMQDDKRSLENGLRIYEGYCKHYEPHGLKYHYVEIPFALYLGQANSFEMMKGQDDVWKLDPNQPMKRDLVYVGIIDAVLEMHSRVYVNDLKTTAWAVSESWLEGFRMDQGLLGYTVAARELLGIDTQYSLVHGIWVQKEPKSGKGKKLDEYFHTKEIFYDESRIAEWHKNTLRTADRIERSKAFDDWQMDWGQNCGAFGGCSYRPLCSAPPNFRKRLAELDYDKMIWTPLEDERLQKMDEGGMV
jgi:hypothetical protein